MAKKLVITAKECGADAIKFQLFKASVLYPEKNSTAYSVTKENEFPREWVKEISEYAKSHEIDFLATPFDHEAIDILDNIDIKFFKWGSSETTNKKLLFYVASKQRPIILSTGMCTMTDISEAIEILENNNCNDIAVLQCHSLYPTKYEDVNLNVMKNLGSTFNKVYGISDHSLGISIPIAAAALGASIVEKHITLDKNQSGPDHFYALEPHDFKSMVENIRNVNSALGTSTKQIFEEEKFYGRRNGIYTNKDLQKNHILTLDDLTIKRPAVSIPQRFVDVVIGSKLNTDIKKNMPIYWNNISYK